MHYVIERVDTHSRINVDPYVIDAKLHMAQFS